MPMLTDDRDDDRDEHVVDGDYDDITESVEDLETEIENIIADFGEEETNSAYLKIYRAIENTGRWEHLFDALPSELPLQDRLHADWGGGHYQARLYLKKLRRNSNKPAKTMVRKFDMWLGEPKKQPVIKQDNKELTTVMIEGFNRLGELIAAQKAPAVDPMALQTNVIQNMIAMKELLSDGKPTAQDPMSQMKNFVEIQKLLLDNAGGQTGAGTEDVLLGLANNLLPQLGKMAEEEQQYQQRQQVRRRPGQPGQPGRIAQAGQPGQPGQAPKRPHPMQNNLIFLTEMAKADADPFLYAQVVVDRTPVDQLNELIEFVSAPDAMDQIAKIYPPAGAYPGWFGELGQSVLELFQSSPEQSEVPHTNNRAVPHTNNAVNSSVEQTPPGVTGVQVFNVPDTGADTSAQQNESAAPGNPGGKGRDTQHPGANEGAG